MRSDTFFRSLLKSQSAPLLEGMVEQTAVMSHPVSGVTALPLESLLCVRKADIDELKQRHSGGFALRLNFFAFLKSAIILQGGYASMSVATDPATSVRRISRPA
jgi:hypothetical protein